MAYLDFARIAAQAGAETLKAMNASLASLVTTDINLGLAVGIALVILAVLLDRLANAGRPG